MELAATTSDVEGSEAVYGRARLDDSLSEEISDRRKGRKVNLGSLSRSARDIVSMTSTASTHDLPLSVIPFGMLHGREE